MGLVVLVKKNVSPHYSQHELRQIRAVSRTIAAWKLTNYHLEVRDRLAAERGSQIVHQDIRGQHVISAASEESNHITIVLLQSYRNDLCLLLLFTFICFLHFFFFRIKLVYMYAMKLSFSITKTKKVFSVLYIHNRFILQLSHLVNHVLIAPYRSL